MIINVPGTILTEEATNGSCVASGRLYSRMPPFYIIVRSNEAGCNIKLIGSFQKIKSAHYQQNFNITCGNGTRSVRIQCFTHLNDERAIVHIKGTYEHAYMNNLAM